MGDSERDSAEVPGSFWDARDVERQLAKDANLVGVGLAVPSHQSMPMQVAVRLRPLWAKEHEAGDYDTVKVLENKVVVVLDPWYAADH